MRHHLPSWESLTNDPFILDAIKHHHIEFEAEYPTQTVQTNKINFSAAEIMTIDAEIAKLITKEVLQVTNRVPCQVPQPIITTWFLYDTTFTFVL